MIDPSVRMLARFSARIDCHESGQAAAVVADARTRQDRTVPLHADVGALRKDRVEMRGDHKVWPRPNTRTLAEHIAGLVDPDILQDRAARKPIRSACARAVSLNGGAGISQNRIWSSMACDSSARTASSAARTSGLPAKLATAARLGLSACVLTQRERSTRHTARARARELVRVII